jgi:hypothetical protein
MTETNGFQKSIALWIGIVATTAGGLTAPISLGVLSQPVSEENLWTLYAIPYLIVGCCVLAVGIVTILLHYLLKLMGK